MSNKCAIIVKKIIRYCEDIARYTEGQSEQDFLADDKTISACAFCLGQIGELTKQMDENVKAQYPRIPWHKMYGLRNRIVHNYEGVDMSQVWVIVHEDIPNLKTLLETIRLSDTE